MRIISDNPELERHLVRMAELIVNNGGYIHEDFVLDARDGDLRVEAPKSLPERDTLISVPDALLLPVDGFGLHLEGDDICLGQPQPEMSSLRIELMEEMAAIYNLCGKIKHHRETAPSRLFLERPDIFKNLVLGPQFSAREKTPKEDFYLHDFIQARKFGRRSESVEDRQSVLMPYIDFINHHQGASGFFFRDDELKVLRRSPVEGSDECFVSYSRMDAQIAFTNYGFLDKEATFAISIPMTINLPGLVTINVNRSIGAKRGNPVPAPLKDIERLVPRFMFDPSGQKASISSITIPDRRTPRAMRRILMAVLSRYVQGRHPDEVHEYLLEAERQILDANRKYYSQLRDYAANTKVEGDLQSIIDDTVRMAEHQLGIMTVYELNIADFQR